MRRKKRSSAMLKKIVVMFAAVVLIVVATISGTLAWLTAETQEVTNTFTVGNINITLDEAKTDKYGNPLNEDDDIVVVSEAERVNSNTYTLLPGKTYTKDPTVTVLANSEKCYLFVVVQEPSWTIDVDPSDNVENNKSFSDYVSYTANWKNTSEWIALDKYTNVYYKEVDSSAFDQSFKLMESFTVSGDSVNKQMMDAFNENSDISKTLAFYAGAVQFDAIGDASDAFLKLSNDITSKAIPQTQS